MKRQSRYLIAFWVFLLCLLGIIYADSQLSNHDHRYQATKAISKKLLLTDLCLSTESRHTRHISMPEWIAPFQDFPGYHDHFPSSSFFQPQKK